MEKASFDAILPLKAQDIVSLLVEQEHLSFEEAVKALYQSNLYTSLSTEESKLWHLGSKKIVELLLEERKGSSLKFPDFV